MASDIKLTENTVIVEGDAAVELKAPDLLLDHAARRSISNNQEGSMRRALVHFLPDDDKNQPDKLAINFGGDYPGGVEVQGSLKVDGECTLAQGLRVGTIRSGSPGGVEVQGSLKVDGECTLAQGLRVGTIRSGSPGGVEVQGSLHVEGVALTLGLGDTPRVVLQVKKTNPSDPNARQKLVINAGAEVESNLSVQGKLTVAGDASSAVMQPAVEIEPGKVIVHRVTTRVIGGIGGPMPVHTTCDLVEEILKLQGPRDEIQVKRKIQVADEVASAFAPTVEITPGKIFIRRVLGHLNTNMDDVRFPQITEMDILEEIEKLQTQVKALEEKLAQLSHRP